MTRASVSVLVLVLALVLALNIPTANAGNIGERGIGVDTHYGSAKMDHSNQFGGDKARNSLKGRFDADMGRGGGPQFESYGLQGDYGRYAH